MDTLYTFLADPILPMLPTQPVESLSRNIPDFLGRSTILMSGWGSATRDGSFLVKAPMETSPEKNIAPVQSNVVNSTPVSSCLFQVAQLELP